MYAENLLRKRNEDLIYRIYITDCLRTIAENTAKFAGGSVLKSRYYDLIQPQKKTVPEKTSEEILADINRKLAEIRGENNA